MLIERGSQKFKGKKKKKEVCGQPSVYGGGMLRSYFDPKTTRRETVSVTTTTNCPCYNIIYPIPIPGKLASPYLQEQLGECSDPDASTSPAGHWYLREESVPPRPPKKKKKKNVSVCFQKIYIYIQLLRRRQEICVQCIHYKITYPDDSGVGDMAIELKEMADLDSLLPPVVATDTPGKRELERTAV